MGLPGLLNILSLNLFDEIDKFIRFFKLKEFDAGPMVDDGT